MAAVNEAALLDFKQCASRVVKPNQPERKAVDVGALLREAAATLNVGEMQASGSFDLYESMSAMEVMDPQMDAGMHVGNARSLDECIASGDLPESLTAAQMVQIIDQLLVREQTWLDAHPVVQTLFTCLYLHRYVFTTHVCGAHLCFTPLPPLTSIVGSRDIIPSAVLKAYCRGFLMGCVVQRDMILKADVYDEEVRL
jgi:hypothetical protein